MNVSNFPGMVAVKNWAPFTVEFQWNSFIYSIGPDQVSNMPADLAYGAIKNSIYRIAPDGTTYSYILPLGCEPPEPILPPTGDAAKDYTLELEHPEDYKLLPVTPTDRIKHARMSKGFSLSADGRTSA